jgi:hypothetical protein
VIHDLGRLRWHTGLPEFLQSGMDVAVFANGKIRALHTFIETPYCSVPIRASICQPQPARERK